MQSADRRHERETAGRLYEFVVRDQVSTRCVDRLGEAVDSNGSDSGA